MALKDFIRYLVKARMKYKGIHNNAEPILISFDDEKIVLKGDNAPAQTFRLTSIKTQLKLG